MKESDFKKLARVLKLPSDVLLTRSGDEILGATWSKRGGQSGRNVVDRVRATAETLGWRSNRNDFAVPDGSTVGSSDALHSPEGHKLITATRFGSTARDNVFTINLKLSSVTKEGNIRDLARSDAGEVQNVIARSLGYNLAQVLADDRDIIDQAMILARMEAVEQIADMNIQDLDALDDELQIADRSDISRVTLDTFKEEMSGIIKHKLKLLEDEVMHSLAKKRRDAN